MTAPVPSPIPKGKPDDDDSEGLSGSKAGEGGETSKPSSLSPIQQGGSSLGAGGGSCVRDLEVINLVDSPSSDVNRNSNIRDKNNISISNVKRDFQEISGGDLATTAGKETSVGKTPMKSLVPDGIPNEAVSKKFNSGAAELSGTHNMVVDFSNKQPSQRGERPTPESSVITSGSNVRSTNISDPRLTVVPSGKNELASNTIDPPTFGALPASNTGVAPEPKTSGLPAMLSLDSSAAVKRSAPSSGRLPTPSPKKARESKGPEPHSSVGGEKVIFGTVASETAPTQGKLPAHRGDNDGLQANGTNQKGSDNSAAMPPPSQQAQGMPACDPFFASTVDLSAIPEVPPLPWLSPRDIAELESALQIGDKYQHGEDGGWKEDWSGNLQLIDKEIVVNRGRIAQDPQTRPVTMPFVEWSSKVAGDNPNGLRGANLLFSYVYHMKGTPGMAKQIMAHSLYRPANTAEERLKYIYDGVRRISYDPTVLTQDGWTTAKAESPDGVSGGAFLIGRRVIWHRYEAIVIAFVRDEEIGDLWKAMWLEDHDTFDLEADELQDALKKYERKELLRQKKLASQTLSGATAKPQGVGRSGGTRSSSSMRFAASANLTVPGIEHGIVLASTFHPNARQGLPWPARVMHVSEVKALTGTQFVSKRSSSKNTVHVVFLAPYWNGQFSFSSKKSSNAADPLRSGPLATQDPFATGPLFEMDSVEVSEGSIQKYPYDAGLDTLHVDKLRAEFRFLGLPKAAFPRYLNAHRLAIAFKAYAKREIVKKPNTHSGGSDHAFAALTDTHMLSVQTNLFPQAALDLPFEYVLSQLPNPVEESAHQLDGEDMTEKVLDLDSMLNQLKPPHCWGIVTPASSPVSGTGKDTKNADATPEDRAGSPKSATDLASLKSPDSRLLSSVSSPGNLTGDVDAWSAQKFASEFLLGLIRTTSTSGDGETLKLSYLEQQFVALIEGLRHQVGLAKGLNTEQRSAKLGALLRQCLASKSHGEDMIVLCCEDAPGDGSASHRGVVEWRKACERVYRRACSELSTPGVGDGVTCILTDSRCNQHITASGSFERAVRLPATIKGARKAGAGTKEGMPLVQGISQKFIQLTEEKILPKAHKASYIKRLKNKISSLAPDAKGVPLTDDSEGEGGEDTMGSRGSYTAAVVGVAAALQGADMIVNGQCVNAFCAIRPPGHHAGRELRPMNAISNGFCLFNSAACAALYATSPRSEGGLGLRRVCVIDFDVHHGNGTQDILCSTHDPRFLYVSLHAGGAHINGYDDGGETHDGFHHGLGDGRHEGIFPGRCGDTSPHDGVLNIPLGKKVTAAAVGNALVTVVAPAVEAFSPELIILSAGFDAHKNDPLGMGGLSAEDFGSVTEVACQMAFKSCSGRVLSVLEGGYGVPCCRPRDDLFLPESLKPALPSRLLELGSDLPDDMDDPMTTPLQQKLDRCHQEGFLHCVQEHIGSLAKCNKRT